MESQTFTALKLHVFTDVWRADSPLWFSFSIFAPFSNKSFRILTAPVAWAAAATCNGVSPPCPIGKLGSAPDFSNIFAHFSPLVPAIWQAMCNDVSLLSPPLECKTNFTLFSNFENLGGNQDRWTVNYVVFVTCWRGSRCWSVFCWLSKSVVWLFSGWRFKKSAPATAAAGGEKPHYWWSSLFKQEHILWTVNDVGSQRRSLQLLRGPSRWKMPKLETWKDTSKVIMARRVHSMGSLPGNIIDGSQCIYNNEIQKPDKDIGSMPKKAFNNFRIASLDGQM